MKKIIFAISCFLLILLFIYAGVSKLLDFNGFAMEMKNQPFPKFLALSLTWIIPPVEIVIAICIIFDASRLKGLYASLVVMVIFSIYTSMVLAHVFPYVPCSCGGIIKKLTWPQHLLFDLFFVCTSLIAIAAEPTKTNLNYFMHENRESRKPA